MPMEQWYVNVLNDVSPDVHMDFDAFRDTSGDPMAWASGSAWAIPRGSPNPQAACRFARTMTETQAWVAAAKKRISERGGDGSTFTGLLTANADADEAIRAMVKPSGSTVGLRRGRDLPRQRPHLQLPANPAGEEFETAWQDGVNRVLNGQQSPEEALAEAQDGRRGRWTTPGRAGDK